jgi:glycosyltransferase involved in cell wall biosynthesis
LKPSLSVVLPVHNVQTTLAATVETLLEIVPELTDRFELVLIDDASTDATGDTARDLSISYPQVQLLTQSTPLGPLESFRSGIRFTHGELLLLANDRPAFDLHEIGKLWDVRKDDGAVWAKATVVGRLGSIPRPPVGQSSTGDASTPDLLLVPRRLLTGWTMRGERADVLTYLRHRGYVVERRELRSVRQAAAAPTRSKFSGEALVDAPVTAHRPNLLQSKWRGLARGRSV